MEILVSNERNSTDDQWRLQIEIDSMLAERDHLINWMDELTSKYEIYV